MDTGPSGCDYSNAGGTDCGYNVQTASSEMAHLHYVSLGNLAYCPPRDETCADGPQTGFGLTNTGNFQNLQPDLYWSGTEFAPQLDSAWDFDTFYGSQSASNKQNESLAMAVRPGDVLAVVNEVPEPGALLLTAAALVGLGVARRKGSVGASRA